MELYNWLNLHVTLAVLIVATGSAWSAAGAEGTAPVSSRMAATGGMPPLFADQDKPFFSDEQPDKPLFDSQTRPLFSGPLLDEPETIISSPKAPPDKDGAGKIDARYRVDQRDQGMRNQMQEVAQWLTMYGIRNGSRFPGLVNDEMYAAQVQLSELVPTNPYNPGTTVPTAGFGVPAQYNANGSPATGSPIWQDDYTSHLQAQQNARVVLGMDYSITPLEIDQWTAQPPQDWQAAPGTITALGNNQGLFIVWGAGADGKPIKNLYTGGTLIVVGKTSGTVNDQIAPNE